MKLTETKLKELILETMEEEDTELFMKILRKALESEGGEHRETFEFLLDSMDVSPEEARKYIDIEEVAEMFMNIKDNEQFRTLKIILSKFNYSVSDLKEYLDLETLKKHVTPGPEKYNSSAYVAKADFMLALMEEKGEDIVEFGKSLSHDAVEYMENLVASKHRQAWAPMLIMTQDFHTLTYLLMAWFKSKDILTDDQLIQMYKSAPREFRQKMKTYRSLPPAVRKAVDEFKEKPSRLQRRLRRKKKK
jgi:hypothetical protein